jgi:hypothetical protein
MTPFGLMATQSVIPVWEHTYRSAVFAGVELYPFKQMYVAMAEPDLIACTRQFMVVWSDPLDLRGRFFRSFKGWTGNGGDAQEWSFVDRTIQVTTNDHQYHVCLRWHRRWSNTVIARDAAISILRGENRHTWLRRPSE